MQVEQLICSYQILLLSSVNIIKWLLKDFLFIVLIRGKECNPQILWSEISISFKGYGPRNIDARYLKKI